MLRLSLAILLVAFVSAENSELEENGLEAVEEKNEDGMLGIINGQMAKQGQFPFTVALYNDGDFLCTASIITENNVMTAAHCVVFNGVQQAASSYNAIIGNVNRSSPDAKQIFFKKITVHPKYGNSENDIAIMETTAPINFTKDIQPICIAGSKFSKLLFKTVTAMGWGQDSRDENSSPEILRYVQQRVIPNSECSIFYLGRRFPASLLCARGLSSGVCFGDSGGPLVYQKNSRSPMVEVGIASFVNSLVGCGTILGPAGFTRVSSFNDFIMNTAQGKVCVA